MQSGGTKLIIQAIFGNERWTIYNLWVSAKKCKQHLSKKSVDKCSTNNVIKRKSN